MMAGFLKCFLGPRLFRIHKNGNEEGREYVHGILESTGDSIIKVMRFCYSLSCWTSPVLIPILYRRGYFTMEGASAGARFLFSVGILYVAAILVRGIGRFSCSEYMSFISILAAAQRSLTEQNMRTLTRYDFEFWAWPVNFRWDQGNRVEGSKPKVKVSKITRPDTLPGVIKGLPCGILRYIAAHTFGRRMVYPGSTALINALLSTTLIQQRGKQIEEKSGKRAKVLTEDNNDIDTMFIDRREIGTEEGRTLVVCCEGNSAFYEMGCMGTPMEGGYSVLGWNHPGFAGSSGVPTPNQEQNAMDAVMQYAIHDLKFIPENIILFSWSIGGYASTWAAMNYPDVKYVVLDATFDDLVPLATAKMPQAWKSLVVRTIRTYLNLNIAEQLLRYPGPILLIRRSRDEMITTREPHDISSNRGNNLLIKILQHRYPKLVDNSTVSLLWEYLTLPTSQQASLLARHEVEESICVLSLLSYMETESSVYPLQIGADYSQSLKNQMTLFLASKYMLHYDSTHCTPLPVEFFQKPFTAHL